MLYAQSSMPSVVVTNSTMKGCDGLWRIVPSWFYVRKANGVAETPILFAPRHVLFRQDSALLVTSHRNHPIISITASISLDNKLQEMLSKRYYKKWQIKHSISGLRPWGSLSLCLFQRWANNHKETTKGIVMKVFLANEIGRKVFYWAIFSELHIIKDDSIPFVQRWNCFCPRLLHFNKRKMAQSNCLLSWQPSYMFLKLYINDGIWISLRVFLNQPFSLSFPQHWS